MKKIYLAAFALMGALSVAAQDTYESGRLLGSDLNGTARYVGMGGAMDALGADISTISSNPAGIGFFRHSNISLSMGVVSQQDAKKFDDLSKTNVSFDQAGFVYSARISTSYIILAQRNPRITHSGNAFSASEDLESDHVTLSPHDLGKTSGNSRKFVVADPRDLHEGR